MKKLGVDIKKKSNFYEINGLGLNGFDISKNKL